MNTPYYLFFFMFLIGLSACSEEATIETVDDLTVEAYLKAGEPVSLVRFGRLIPLDSTQFLGPPTDLEPKIIVDGETFPLFPTEVDGIFQNLDLIIETGKTYRLEVEYNGELTTAETFILTAPENLTLSQTSIEVQQINDIGDVLELDPPDPVEVDWDGPDGAYYFVTVDNLETNPERVNTLVEDNEGGGFLAVQTEPSTESVYDINTFQDITFFGTYRVEVFRVNAEYLAVYDDNSSGSNSLNQITTNVVNGFGLFTGVNSSVVFLEVIKE
ncbi:MAG: DUF4249 family protein [Bacteroidota bacterium]